MGTSPQLGDLGSPWLLTPYDTWDDPPGNPSQFSESQRTTELNDQNPWKGPT